MKKTLFIFLLMLWASIFTFAQTSKTENQRRQLAAKIYNLPSTATWAQISAAHIESERQQIIQKFNLPKSFTWQQVNDFLNGKITCSCNEQSSGIDEPYIVEKNPKTGKTTVVDPFGRPRIVPVKKPPQKRLKDKKGN